jgi:hypothetical protein
MPSKQFLSSDESSVRISFNAVARWAAIFLAGAFLAGCGKGEPEYYEVKEIKEVPKAVETEHEHAHAEVQAAAEAHGGSRDIKFSKPESWSEKVPGRMVLKSFQAGKPPEAVADVNVSAFPGDVGGQLANVNRWRRQLGLPPISEAELSGAITEIKVAGADAWQVDLSSDPEMVVHGSTARMVVTAIPHAGQTWFIKLTGIEGAVAGQLENYEAFVQSIHF